MFAMDNVCLIKRECTVWNTPEEERHEQMHLKEKEMKVIYSQSCFLSFCCLFSTLKRLSPGLASPSSHTNPNIDGVCGLGHRLLINVMAMMYAALIEHKRSTLLLEWFNEPNRQSIYRTWHHRHF